MLFGFSYLFLFIGGVVLNPLTTHIKCGYADMMKLVDISDLGSDEAIRGGSSPSIRKRVRSSVGRALGF